MPWSRIASPFQPPKLLPPGAELRFNQNVPIGGIICFYYGRLYLYTIRPRTWTDPAWEACLELQLTGKTALITGASKGIGRATALTMASEGVSLHLAARSTDELEKLQKEIAAKY